MKSYITDIIPKISSYSKKLDDLSLLKNQNWVLINQIQKSKTVYIFRDNSQLLIIENGIVSNAGWEYINSNSLIIERNSKPMLFKHGFLDPNVLLLSIDGSDNEYIYFINESRANRNLNSVNDVNNYLRRTYLTNKPSSTNNPSKPYLKTFYCLNPKSQKEYGPYSAPEIVKKLKNGRLQSSYLVRESSIEGYQHAPRIMDLLEK